MAIRTRTGDTARGTLDRVMLFDLERRQEILLNELSHLTDAITYRRPDDIDSNSSNWALLKQIAEAASELSAETEADIKERKGFKSWWESTVVFNADLPTGAVRIYQCFRLVWHAKMMIKASVIAERLGELHDRLGQQIERTNPDYPNPVLRRRAEHGQIDKYLCEHVKWVHRDLVLAAKKLGADYPYKEVPVTLYSWQYQASSTQHAFVSHKHYEDWKQWALGSSTEVRLPSKFTSLGLSYWMPERLVSHPIIGHELAHQVLQDLYGRDNPYVRLEHQKDQLSRTLRRLIRCAEGWQVNRSSGRGSTTAQTWPLVREIMCDLLAAERYGCAYLHAWLMEICEIETMADLMHDCFGMLKPIVDFSKITPEFIQREIFTPSRALIGTEPLNIYYRGTVLVAFLRMHKRETDLMTQELLQQVDNWLDRYLDLATGVHAEPKQTTELHYGREFEHQFARDLALCVTEEFSRGSPLMGKLRNRDSKFIRAAKNHWQCNKGNIPIDFSLSRQVLSNPVRLKFLELITKYRKNAFIREEDKERVRTIHDALWRVEWAIEDLDNGPRNKLRALIFLGIDDYLYRTGNPYRLLQTILLHRKSHSKSSPDPDEGTSTDVDSVVQCRTSRSNSLNEDWLRGVYDPDWLPVLNNAIRDKCGVVLKLNNISLFALSKEDIAKLSPLLFQEADFERIGLGSSSLNALHLVSLKPAKSDNAQSQLQQKYDTNTSSLLLGRYDALTMGHMPEHERASVEGLCAVSRLKRLVSIGQTPGKEEGIPLQRLATILISLRWDASRIMFADWLRTYLNESSRPAYKVYLSDGWEDIVLVVPTSNTVVDAKQIDDLLELIRKLNNLPLVAGTESLFDHVVLCQSPSLRFRFVCTRGADGLQPTVEMIRSGLGALLGWRLENLSGAKDLQVVLDEHGVTSDVYDALHRAADGDIKFRVETRVSWELKPETCPSVAVSSQCS